MGFHLGRPRSAVPGRGRRNMSECSLTLFTLLTGVFFLGENLESNAATALEWDAVT